jgi:23S rRNA pseudouridine2457 synthase
MPTLLLLNKPFKVLSQFTQERVQERVPERTPEKAREQLPVKTPKETLASYITQKHVYPAGRLDYDSEGLLLLTDDGALQQHISHPQYKLPKTYWVQVEGEHSTDAIRALCHGVQLKDGLTKPALVEPMPEPDLWPRDPPVRFRQSIPTHWLSITISEGKNRQVRRMTAAVGLPTLRLVRASIGDWTLEGLQPGEHRSITVPSPPTPTNKASKPKQRHPRTNADKANTTKSDNNPSARGKYKR